MNNNRSNRRRKQQGREWKREVPERSKERKGRLERRWKNAKELEWKWRRKIEYIEKRTKRKSIRGGEKEAASYICSLIRRFKFDRFSTRGKRLSCISCVFSFFPLLPLFHSDSKDRITMKSWKLLLIPTRYTSFFSGSILSVSYL